MDTATVQSEFLQQLFAHRLLIPSGVDGLYGRGTWFERVVEGIDAAVQRIGAPDNAEALHFPPVVTQHNYQLSEHFKSFPDLVGVVRGFRGKDKDHLALVEKMERGEDWAANFGPTGVIMTPAACYPIYPTLKGTIPPEGKRVTVLSYCFRYEPSLDPARLQMFRQREHVRIGTPDDVREFAATWKARGEQLFKELSLDSWSDVANDPFFGRVGKMLAANQRDQGLKFELLVPITSREKPTACCSFNYHQDHFGHLFEIKLPTGEWAHTACVGFGLERTTLALFKTHGFDVEKWPATVRERLKL
ncbi:MAG: amino acid--[acyl-carrier-protein] ligase [Deltaproteobacteria bacterium]|nr:amino acid--[acyl-carrier-protein] ligase [Deltaproteobacteria bacterium]